MLAEHLPVVAGDDEEGRSRRARAALELLRHLAPRSGPRRPPPRRRDRPLPLRCEQLRRLVGCRRFFFKEERLVLVPSPATPSRGPAAPSSPLALAAGGRLVHGLEAVVVTCRSPGWCRRRRSRTKGWLTIAPVTKPLPRRPARVCLASGKRVSRLSRRPWVGGRVPVSMETWAGRVMGAGGADVLEQDALPGHGVDVRRLFFSRRRSQCPRAACRC